MPIDFSKINLSVLPRGGNVVKSPSRTKAPLGGRIDYGAIKLSNIYAHAKAAPKPAQKIPVSAVSSTPFIGRPLVTPVEQQRMKAATPIPAPPAISRLTGKYDPQKYNPEVTPVAPLLQTAAVKRWSAEAAAVRKATPEIGQRLLDGMDSFTKIIQPNITPKESGRNTVVDFVGSIASVAAGVYAVKSLLSTLGAGVLWLKTPRTVIDRETTTLFPRFDDSFQAQKYVLKLQQTDPAAAEKFKSDLVTLLAQTMAKDMPTTLSDESLQETASRMYNFLVSNGEAGSFATVGERFASATTAVSKLAAAVGNPQMSLAVAEQATNQLAKTGMLQLLPPLVVANRLGTIPMPAGLVHSTAPAIPMGGGTLPAVSVATAPTAPPQITQTAPAAKAPTASRYGALTHLVNQVPTSFVARASDTRADLTESVSVEAMAKLKADIKKNGIQTPFILEYNPETGFVKIVEGIHRLRAAQELGIESLPVTMVRAETPVTDTNLSIGKYTGNKYLERQFAPSFLKEIPTVTTPAAVTQPVQAPTVKSYADIMAKEEEMGARLNTTPRVVDKTIPAIDVKKYANLVDVTGKVDLKSVQVQFPRATNVFVDIKRQTVLFTDGATPLEAIGIDKPQLKTWYGIEGAKLLGEIARPVVAQIAPTLSKMETPLVAPKELQPLVAEAKKYPSAEAFVAAIENPTNLTTKGLMVGQKNLPVGGEFTGRILIDKKGGKWYDVRTPGGELTPIPVEEAKVATGWGSGLADFYDTFVGKPASVPPSLSTTPQKGTATTISNQKTGISTSTPVSSRVGTQTGASEVKWGKWIDAVGTRRTDGVGGYGVETIKTPTTYRLASGTESVRAYSPTKAADKGISGPFVPETGKRLELKGDPHTYYITQKSEADAIAEGNPSYRPFSVLEASSGNLIGWGDTVKNAVGNAQETINNFKEIYGGRVKQAVADHGEIANPASVPPALITSTSAPAAAPSLGNATPAHGLIDYSKIELNGPAVPAHAGTTSQTSPKVLASVGNAGKRSRVETEGFDNYIQNTTGTKETSLSPFAKFKEGRDLQVRRYENEFDGLMKTPAGAEWMTLAIEADEVLREEYARPFAINEAGERVFVEGEFAPAILNRYLKQYGPNFGKFLQHLQRAGISTETTLGLSAEKEALKQKHIYDARMSLADFQKNEPQLFTAYMAAADELGNANALLAEFYKGMISPETYANDKANPHYYVSLSAGKTDVFDRSGVAPLERTHGLTDLEHVVEPLEGLKAVYVDAIRAQGINNAKREAVKSNKNSEVATTELSDSIVHLKENGLERAYDVHDTNVTQSVHNLTLKKPEVPTWEKHLVKDPTTALRLFATGLNPAFGLYNIMRDTIQSIGTVPFDPTGLVKGTIRAFKSPQLSQWFDSYRDPMMSKGARATEAIKKILEIVTFPNEIGEGLIRSITAETIIHRGGSYLDQLHGYYASTGFFALHGTFFNDFIPSCIPFTRATIAVVRAAYRNTFFGLPIGDKGGTFSGKQGAEKLAGRNLATIIFTIVSALAIKEAGKEKEYKLLRDRASYFYFPTPSGAWVKLPVPIGFVPIKGIVDSLFGYKSDPLGVAGQTLDVIPGLEAFMLPPALALFLQYKFNINFFTGAAITAAVGTPAANPLEAALMKTGMDEGQAAFLVRAFLADIPSQVQYVFDMVGQGSSTQALPASKRFIVKDPTTSSNAAVDDFYALVDAVKASKNPALEHYVNGKASDIGKLLHNAKAYPAEAKLYMTTATDNIIATFATIAENPDAYGIKKYGPFSWRPSGNYEELAP